MSELWNMDPCGQLQNRFVTHTAMCWHPESTVPPQRLSYRSLACRLQGRTSAARSGLLLPRQLLTFRLAMCFLQLMHILVVIAMAHLHRGATLDFQDFVSRRACR